MSVDDVNFVFLADFQNVEEFALLKTSDKVYYSGSAIEFGLVVLDQYFTPSQLSEIVYLELVHEQYQYHEKFVFRLDSGKLNAFIELPTNIPTGNYQLVAYTHFMHNSSIGYARDRVSIYIQNVTEDYRPISDPKDRPWPDSSLQSIKNDFDIELVSSGDDWVIKLKKLEFRRT